MCSRKFRYTVLAVMTALTAACLFLFPRININEDMSRYLPDDSRMKQGVDTLAAYFPETDMNALWVRAMFSGVSDRDSLSDVLSGIDGVAGVLSVDWKEDLTLYQLSVGNGADAKAIAAGISSAYGDRVVVEHNGNSIMPDNMGMILIIGVAMVFGILFLMCSSFVEALLFIVAIGMAVVLNIGTNAFLPSVSMLTNTIVAVLQLVLSMDYSIILMNRFRQMLQDEPDIDRAMGMALKSASPSILSSGFTTIVGLLALLFMKFKIGMDLGIVLAKGVMFSLIAAYTILPAIILLFYKGIQKTEKRVFLIPVERLSRFELRFRIPLALLFVAISALSWHLAGKTELSYASIWESRINDTFPPKNNFSILYRTSSEERVIPLTDSILSDSGVAMVLNYPSLFKREMTAEEMLVNIRSLLPLLSGMPGVEIPDMSSFEGFLTPETIRMLYYAASHPQRGERMSFEDMILLAEEASATGLLPEGTDVASLIGLLSVPETEPAPETGPAPAIALAPEPAAVPVTAPEPASAPETGPEPAAAVDSSGRESVAVEEVGGTEQPAGQQPVGQQPASDDPYGLRGKHHFTKEKINTPMDSDELAEYLGFSKGQASAAYSMAKRRSGKMTPDEFINYMINNVLGNKLLRRMISGGQIEDLYYIRAEMDKVLSAEDIVPTVPAAKASAVPDSSVNAVPLPEQSIPQAVPAGNREEMPVTEMPVTAVPTPMERLAEMYASGLKYSAGQVWSALHNAGINQIDRGTVNLMFTFYGSRNNYDEGLRMSLDSIIDFLSEKVAVSDDYAAFVDDSTRAVLGGLRGMVDEGMRMLRRDGWSMSAVVTDYPIESDATFSFVERTLAQCDAQLGEGESYLVGESVMYKEMKDGFRRELLMLTLLTVVSIFLIVAVTFRSALIPLILVLTVMTGVNVNVFFSGAGGHTMLYLAYLIVQSILMGATIDYGILFTNYYLGFRRDGLSKADALRKAYEGSIHTIMTSGLIIILAPFIMSELLTDPTICSILSSLTFGALAAITLIVFVLPAVLAATDKLITRRGHIIKASTQRYV